MSFEGIGRIFSKMSADVLKGEAASRESIKNQSPLKRINNTKYSNPDSFSARTTGEALAGQVHAHSPLGFKKNMHSAKSTRGQKVLKNLLRKTDSRLGVSIHDPLDSDGHESLVSLFKAADQRNDLAA